MNRKALGKGINALIPEFEMGVNEVDPSSTKDLLVDEILPNRLQPRSFFNDVKLEELVVSIKEHGILQPVVVQKADSGYDLIVGERRWRASKKLGLKKIRFRYLRRSLSQMDVRSKRCIIFICKRIIKRFY